MALRIIDSSADPPVQSLGGRTVAIEVDEAIYSVPAVLRASYRMTGSSYVFLHRTSRELLTVFLQPKSEEIDSGTEAGRFSNHLIDEQLRVQIAGETGAIRELVVAQAFAEGNLLDGERDEAESEADPRGIGRRS